jgi:hypothetical protein
MTKDKIAAALRKVYDISSVGCNSQPDLGDLRCLLYKIADQIDDIWFPEYDTLFIKFKEKTTVFSILPILEFMNEMRPDELMEADVTDLDVLCDTKESQIEKYRGKIEKYVRFWWD